MSETFRIDRAEPTVERPSDTWQGVYMALIKEFQQVTSDVQKIHGPVACGYRAFTVEGRRIVQLDTYGSTDRAIPNKISQSLQLDAEGARTLMDILTEAFPDIIR